MISYMFVKCVVVLFFFFVDEGNSVKCYHCSSKSNETECTYPEKYGFQPVICDKTAIEKTQSFAKSVDPRYDAIFAVDHLDMAKNLDLNCLKVVTKVGEKQYIIRGCQLAQQSNIDICHKIREANIDNQLSVVHCSRCAVDKCNLAPQIQTFPIYLTPLLIIRFVVLD